MASSGQKYAINRTVYQQPVALLPRGLAPGRNLFSPIPVPLPGPCLEVKEPEMLLEY
jgi:hypothetical protein